MHKDFIRMLDDLKLIHERDQQDALGIAEHEGSQLSHVFDLNGALENDGIKQVVYGAMGGSALAALMATVWPPLRIPFAVVRDYELPPYVGPETLFIAASYSGNTEETLAALSAAEATGARIAVIAGGGELLRRAEEKDYVRVVLPKVEQPRFAVFYNYRALIQILVQAGVADGQVLGVLDQAAGLVSEAAKAWRPDVPTAQNRAKQIALELIGKSVVVYGGPKMYPAAYKWKISFNENAKHIAWVGQFPEFNHNEFIGWSKQPVDKPYAIIDLRSSLENERVQKRFVVTERLLSGLRPAPIVVAPEGTTLLEQLAWTIALGDFTSIYLALLNGLNPTPVELVERFKAEMAKE